MIIRWWMSVKRTIMGSRLAEQHFKVRNQNQVGGNENDIRQKRSAEADWACYGAWRRASGPAGGILTATYELRSVTSARRSG